MKQRSRKISRQQKKKQSTKKKRSLKKYYDGANATEEELREIENNFLEAFNEHGVENELKLILEKNIEAKMFEFYDEKTTFRLLCKLEKNIHYGRIFGAFF